MFLLKRTYSKLIATIRRINCTQLLKIPATQQNISFYVTVDPTFLFWTWSCNLIGFGQNCISYLWSVFFQVFPGCKFYILLNHVRILIFCKGDKGTLDILTPLISYNRVIFVENIQLSCFHIININWLYLCWVTTTGHKLGILFPWGLWNASFCMHLDQKCNVNQSTWTAFHSN